MYIHLDTDEVLAEDFPLYRKNNIITTYSEDTIFIAVSFTCEDMGIVMVTNKISQQKASLPWPTSS